MPTYRRRRRLREDAQDDARVRELDFSDEDRTPPRTGDPLPPARVAEALPPSRGRYAGLTGASVDGETTGDDLSPETLLDPEGADSPVAGRRGPADRMLRRIGEDELKLVETEERRGQPLPRRS